MTLLVERTRDMVYTALDIDDFRAWLAAKQPDAVIGRTNDCRLCPVAAFLADRAARTIGVGNRTAWWYGSADSPEVTLPDRFQRFIKGLDALDPHGAGLQVMAATALRILDEVLNAQ